jgi:hypothetical protein
VQPAAALPDVSNNDGADDVVKKFGCMSLEPRAAAAATTVTVDGERFGRICIGNLSKKKIGPPAGFVDVRVDRQSACGNPFPMGADGHDESFRDAVCVACDELLENPLTADVSTIAARHGLRVDSRFASANSRTELEAELQRLEGRLRAGESLRLMCWCAPKRCHAAGIARCLNRRLGRPEELLLVGAGGGGGKGGGKGSNGKGGGGKGGGGNVGGDSGADLSVGSSGAGGAGEREGGRGAGGHGSGRGGRSIGRGRGGRGNRGGVSRLQ